MYRYVLGENIVMYLQTARYLMKKLTQSQHRDSPKPDGILSYYHDLSFLKNKCRVKKSSDWCDTQHQIDAFLHRAAKLAMKTKDRMDKMQKQGISYDIAWEHAKQDLVNMARVSDSNTNTCSHIYKHIP